MLPARCERVLFEQGIALEQPTRASSPRGIESLRTCMGVFLSSGFLLLPVSCLEVCPGKAGMFSRRQSCRGKSQSPVVWIAEEMETEPSKPIDKISRGEITSHRAVSKENALWPRKR